MLAIASCLYVHTRTWGIYTMYIYVHGIEISVYYSYLELVYFKIWLISIE